MKKKIFGVFVSLLVVAMLIMLLSVVLATKPGIAVEGVFLFAGPPSFDYSKELPHGWHYSGSGSFIYTGDIVGTAESDFAWNYHFKGGPPKGTVGPLGLVSGRSSHTITVLEFLGEPTTGTITILISNANNQWRITSGTGAFENIHGTGTVSQIPSGNIYEGTIHFDP
jgi:hypothetical protein